MPYDLRELRPVVLPARWREVAVPEALLRAMRANGQPDHQCAAYLRRYDSFRVFLSVDDYPDDAGAWLHVSCSYADRLPRWQDLKAVKELFLGDRIAIQLLPPRAHWMNLHNYTLHLFTRLDADTVPSALWQQGTT